MQHALDGAAAVYLPANRPQLSLLDAASMFFRQGALKPQHGRDMEEGLSPELRARFDRVRDSFHADPKRYRHWKPLVAGLLLLGDFWKAGWIIGRQTGIHRGADGPRGSCRCPSSGGVSG